MAEARAGEVICEEAAARTADSWVLSVGGGRGGVSGRGGE